MNDGKYNDVFYHKCISIIRIFLIQIGKKIVILDNIILPNWSEDTSDNLGQYFSSYMDEECDTENG